jgi:hypothetical protein
MSRIANAKSIAQHSFDEIDASIQVVQSYKNIVVQKSSELFDAFKNNNHAKIELQKYLRHKTLDEKIIYRSLIVHSNSIFEHYVALLVEAVITERFEVKSNYLDLDDDFRKQHIYHAAKILSYIKDGSLRGVHYDFNKLLTNLGKGLSGQQGYGLNPEVFTRLMGNCTPERLENLFAIISLPAPFSDKLGDNKNLQSHFDNRKKRQVSKYSKDKLSKEIKLRNDIVHGDITKSIDESKLRDTVDFFRSFISGIDDIIS